MIQAGPAAIEAKNTFRALGWRWARATRLLQAGNRPSRRVDDEDTFMAFRFRNAQGLTDAPGGNGRRRGRKWAPLLEAQRLQADPGPLRWEIQARRSLTPAACRRLRSSGSRASSSTCGTDSMRATG